jgi:peptidoglycan/LPS O-acetylase OafA/YrhL
MPELDILRGCAILAVLFYHGFYWSGAGSSYRPLRLFIQSTLVGWLGVNLFFVLSGFLITGILLDTKSRPSYFGSFYRRRALRILPAYLATIGVLLFLRWINTASAALAVMFLANYDYLFSLLHLPIYRSFWSLAVEEQFYLLWPAVIAFVSRPALLAISLALVLLEPVLRWQAASHLSPEGLNHATWLIADNLALGALAAIFARSRFGTRRNGIRLGLTLCLTGLAVFAACYRLGIVHRTTAAGAALQPVPWNLCFAGALLLSLGLASSLASSLWTAPLRFLGYISYGLYLIHVLVFGLYDNYVAHRVSQSLRRLLEAPFLRFALAGGICILIAWLSRNFFEQRFLDMGRKPEPSLAETMPQAQAAAASSEMSCK